MFRRLLPHRTRLHHGRRVADRDTAQAAVRGAVAQPRCSINFATNLGLVMPGTRMTCAINPKSVLQLHKPTGARKQGWVYLFGATGQLDYGDESGEWTHFGVISTSNPACADLNGTTSKLSDWFRSGLLAMVTFDVPPSDSLVYWRYCCVDPARSGQVYLKMVVLMPGSYSFKFGGRSSMSLPIQCRSDRKKGSLASGVQTGSSELVVPPRRDIMWRDYNPDGGTSSRSALDEPLQLGPSLVTFPRQSIKAGRGKV